MEAWINGMKSMMPAMVILILAWAIGKVCEDLGTANYLVAQLSGNLNPGFLPAIVFLLAAVTAFRHGNVVGHDGDPDPAGGAQRGRRLATAPGGATPPAHRILLGSVSSVLAGALFGDHCSPISDTTVMSSMSSGCDHVDHVRTQLPYALWSPSWRRLGYLPAGFGVAAVPLPCCSAPSCWPGRCDPVRGAAGARLDRSPGLPRPALDGPSRLRLTPEKARFKEVGMREAVEKLWPELEWIQDETLRESVLA